MVLQILPRSHAEVSVVQEEHNKVSVSTQMYRIGNSNILVR